MILYDERHLTDKKWHNYMIYVTSRLFHCTSNLLHAALRLDSLASEPFQSPQEVGLRLLVLSVADCLGSSLESIG